MPGTRILDYRHHDALIIKKHVNITNIVISIGIVKSIFKKLRIISSKMPVLSML